MKVRSVLLKEAEQNVLNAEFQRAEVIIQVRWYESLSGFKLPSDMIDIAEERLHLAIGHLNVIKALLE